jgi:hypothetical protein
MSAQLQRPERSLFADGNLARATPDEFAAAGSSYIAYWGRFFIDETRTPCPRNGGVPMWPSSLLKLWSLFHLPAEDGGVIAVRCAALAMVVIGIAIIAHSNRL